MGERQKITVSYFDGTVNHNDKCIGCCALKGRVGGWFARIRGSDAALAVVCTGTRANEDTVEALTERFHRWFRDKLPSILHHFSFEVINCYWDEIFRELLRETEETCAVAVLFIYDGWYLFRGFGDFYTYEFQEKKGRMHRFPCLQQQKVYDTELGISSNLLCVVRKRKLSKKSIFYLCSREISNENSIRIQMEVKHVR